MPTFKGELESVYVKDTKKGNKVVAHMAKTSKGNKFWFMGWEKEYNTAGKGKHPEPVLVAGQYIEVRQDQVPAKDIKEDKGVKTVFLKPNPKLVKAGKVDPKVLEAQHLEKELKSRLGNKRAGQAIIALSEKFDHVLEQGDREFVESLAKGAKEYEAVTDNQYPHVCRLVAKYTAKSQSWKEAVQAALEGEDPADDVPSEDDMYGEGEMADFADDDF